MYLLEAAIIPQSIESQDIFEERIYKFDPETAQYGQDFTAEQLGFISELNSLAGPNPFFNSNHKVDRQKLINNLLIPAFNSDMELTNYIKQMLKEREPKTEKHILSINDFVSFAIDYAKMCLETHREMDFQEIYGFLQNFDGATDSSDSLTSAPYNLEEDRSVFSPITHAAKEVQRLANFKSETVSNKLPTVELVSNKEIIELKEYILPINTANPYYDDDIDFVQLVENYTRAEVIINTAKVNLPNSKEEFLDQCQKLYPKLFEKPSSDREFKLAVERFFSSSTNQLQFVESYENFKSEDLAIYRELILRSQARLNYAKSHGLNIRNMGAGNE